MGQKTGWKLPDEIPANEFLNLEGQKISTSKNWAIWVHEFLERFNSDSVRFYLAEIAPETKDADFSFKKFQEANNSLLAGIYGNFANRNLAFINKFFKGKIDGEIESGEEDEKVWNDAITEAKNVLDCYENYKVREAVERIMDLGRHANKYFDTMAPWALRKDNKPRCRGVLLTCMNLINLIGTVLSPITPTTVVKVRKMLNLKEEVDFNTDLEKMVQPGVKLNEVEILFNMIDDETIEAEKARLG